jgi:hypothetical protein
MSRPFIPVPNCASVEMIYSLAGEIVENIFHVQKGSPFTLAQLQALRAVVDTWHNAQYKVEVSNIAILQRIRCKALDSLGAPMEDYTLPTPRAGTLSGTNLPNNCTWCIKLSTGLTGRSFRGRWYIAGLTTAYYGADVNHVSTVAVTNVIAVMTALITALVAGGYTLGVVSYMTGGAWRSTGLFTPATGWVAVDTNLDSMRRRLAGRGR